MTEKSVNNLGAFVVLMLHHKLGQKGLMLTSPNIWHSILDILTQWCRALRVTFCLQERQHVERTREESQRIASPSSAESRAVLIGPPRRPLPPSRSCHRAELQLLSSFLYS